MVDLSAYNACERNDAFSASSSKVALTSDANSTEDEECLLEDRFRMMEVENSSFTVVTK